MPKIVNESDLYLLFLLLLLLVFRLLAFFVVIFLVTGTVSKIPVACRSEAEESPPPDIDVPGDDTGEVDTGNLLEEKVESSGNLVVDVVLIEEVVVNCGVGIKKKPYHGRTDI